MMIEFPSDIRILEQFDISNGIPAVRIDKNDIQNALFFLKNSSEYSFDMLKTVSCSEKNDCFEIMYLLFSTVTKKYFALFVLLDSPAVNSISSIYPSADWDEREIFDLFGVEFQGHPNLKRILLPEAWIGHPLRKNYVNNDERLGWNYERKD